MSIDRASGVDLSNRGESQVVLLVRPDADAGAVLGVQLQETALARSSTLATSSDPFRVCGAVTASIGDQVQVKESVLHGSVGDKPLCIGNAYRSYSYRFF